jgi:hypothetical protein
VGVFEIANGGGWTVISGFYANFVCRLRICVSFCGSAEMLQLAFSMTENVGPSGLVPWNALIELFRAVAG